MASWPKFMGKDKKTGMVSRHPLATSAILYTHTPNPNATLTIAMSIHLHRLISTVLKVPLHLWLTILPLYLRSEVHGFPLPYIDVWLLLGTHRPYLSWSSSPSSHHRRLGCWTRCRPAATRQGFFGQRHPAWA